jgi:hypothetical protein
MASRRVEAAVVNQEFLQARLRRPRKDVAEKIEEVAANEALEVIVRDGRAIRDRIEGLPDRAADVLGGVQQGAVDIEQVDGERGDHAGWEPTLRPGTRRPESGRMTCWV